MFRIVMRDETSLEEFRGHVRALIASHTNPGQVSWSTDRDADLFGETPLFPAKIAKFSVPAAYVELAREVLHHCDPERFSLLYRLLWRLLNEDRQLLSIFSDTLVYKLRHMQRAVGRDLHKMTAFLRFRKVEDDEGDRFIAWFEPQHLILQPAAEFFMKRFANMRWSVLTPDGVINWDRRTLSFGPGVPKSAGPASDSKTQ